MGDCFDCGKFRLARDRKTKINQGQDILQPEEPDTPSIGAILRWLIIIVILGLLFGGGYWYYSHFIIKPAAPATPSPEATEAVWKTKSEKTVNDFLGYWIKSEQNDNEQAKKARDLLTIAGQARLVILKDKLTAFMELSGFPQSYQITSSKKIDEKTVEVTVSFIYPGGAANRIFTCVLDGNSWLIDSVKGESVPSPSPIVSPSLSPSPIPNPTPSAQGSL